MPDSTGNPKTNPAARNSDDVFGSNKPDNVSAACWNRPYEYLVIRVDDDRLKAFDDHPLGRTMSSGLHTRHNAIARRARLSRRAADSAEYRIVPEGNELYEQ
jgi:hypothetical protein